jgi:uncharacterized protein YbaP (TraB family)
MKKTALALSGILLLAVPVRAADSPATAPVVQVHPVAWHIHTGHSEITLFGSLHMLPANMEWLTPDVLHSINRADVFVFEVPTDDISRTTLNAMLDTRGALPAGQSLRAQLPAESQADFDAVMAAEHLSATVTDREKPWLASLQLTLADTMNRKYYPDAGVDYVVMSWANSHNRQVRYLETVNEQLAMLVPEQSEGDQLNEFETTLKRVQQEERDLDPLIDAWGKGDVAKLHSMIERDFEGHPDTEKRLITDRNQEWTAKIEKMAGEWRNFFIVVGAAHLTGPEGVPALLRKDGFEVEGP